MKALTIYLHEAIFIFNAYGCVNEGTSWIVAKDDHQSVDIFLNVKVWPIESNSGWGESCWIFYKVRWLNMRQLVASRKMHYEIDGTFLLHHPFRNTHNTWGVRMIAPKTWWEAHIWCQVKFLDTKFLSFRLMLSYLAMGSEISGSVLWPLQKFWPQVYYSSRP